MQYAIKDSIRREAFKGATNHSCACCNSPVIPKCGDHNIHHWAHQFGGDCDSWSEAEGEWHLSWKRHFPEEWLEVVIGPHRADVKRPDGLVIELQHSSISLTEAIERNDFYKNIIWIFDAHDYISRCSVLSWFGEYPHWKNDWYPYGRPPTICCLRNPSQIEQHNHEFHNQSDKSLLLDSVSMDNAPNHNRDVGYWQKDLSKIQKRIDECKEKLEEYSANPNKVKFWTTNLASAEAEFALRDRAECFLGRTFPANNTEKQDVNLLGSVISGVPLRIKWSHSREAFWRLNCQFFWDVHEDYLLYFPATNEDRLIDKHMECILVRKVIIIEILQN